MKKILFAAVLVFCLILTAGCTETTEPAVNYSSVVGTWQALPDADGVSLGMTLNQNLTGVYGYYAGSDTHTVDIEWYEYGGKYYVYNATANAGNIFTLSEDGKVLSSDDGDVLHRQI
jgi:outer membrane biogenesis lipoprotein LolB